MTVASLCLAYAHPAWHLTAPSDAIVQQVNDPARFPRQPLRPFIANSEELFQSNRSTALSLAASSEPELCQWIHDTNPAKVAAHVGNISGALTTEPSAVVAVSLQYTDDCKRICRWTHLAWTGRPSFSFADAPEINELVCSAVFRDMADYVVSWPYSALEGELGLPRPFVPDDMAAVARCLLPGAIIYSQTGPAIGTFCERMLPHIRVPFIFITGQSDYAPVTPKWCGTENLLDHPLLIKWFAMNPDVRHPKLEGLPLGVQCYVHSYSLLEWLQRRIRKYRHGMHGWNDVNATQIYFQPDPLRIQTLEHARHSCVQAHGSLALPYDPRHGGLSDLLFQHLHARASMPRVEAHLFRRYDPAKLALVNFRAHEYAPMRGPLRERLCAPRSQLTVHDRNIFDERRVHYAAQHGFDILTEFDDKADGAAAAASASVHSASPSDSALTPPVTPSPNWVTCLDSSSYLRNYEESSSFRFWFSPPGNGVDCHRTYEAMYVGAIPIVLHSELDQIFEDGDLPVLLVDHYDNVTEHMLWKFLEKIEWNPYRAFPRKKLTSWYWRERINAVRQKALGMTFDPFDRMRERRTCWGVK